MVGIRQGMLQARPQQKRRRLGGLEPASIPLDLLRNFFSTTTRGFRVFRARVPCLVVSVVSYLASLHFPFLCYLLSLPIFVSFDCHLHRIHVLSAPLPSCHHECLSTQPGGSLLSCLCALGHLYPPIWPGFAIRQGTALLDRESCGRSLWHHHRTLCLGHFNAPRLVRCRRL